MSSADSDTKGGMLRALWGAAVSKLRVLAGESKNSMAGDALEMD